MSVKYMDLTYAVMSVMWLVLAVLYFERRQYYRIIQRQQAQIDTLREGKGTAISEIEANRETAKRE